MKKKNIIVLVIASILIGSTAFILSSKKEKTRLIQIETRLGNVVISLYDETPQHRDNMLKLVDQGYYNGLLFHRVIKGFMIQGGDPASKGSQPGAVLGMGGPGYTVPAEFNTKFIHKKGALSAARLGDQQNPLKASSGSQFYLVQGSIVSDAQLDAIEKQRIESKTIALIREYLSQPNNSQERDSVMLYQQQGNGEKLNKEIESIKKKLSADIKALDKYKYTQEQREIYKSIGGAPHLDFEYTVYGEVVEGLDVIDKIAEVSTDRSDRPVEDITMNMSIK